MINSSNQIANNDISKDLKDLLLKIEDLERKLENEKKLHKIAEDQLLEQNNTEIALSKEKEEFNKKLNEQLTLAKKSAENDKKLAFDKILFDYAVYKKEKEKDINDLLSNIDT